ncbi:MAG: RlmE family RNA methyltransferase [Pseudomonadota bacterium]|nr:MAG: RlmE family RNA methyltransferase [Pseudomonadota bacterium]
MPRSKSSSRWLQRHVSDEFVKRAQKEGYRSRAAYKLQEIDQRDRVFRGGMTVVDLGAAPGGWSQYAASRVAPGGRVIALDVLPMEPIPGVEFLLGDFTENAVLELLRERLGGRQVDLVMSDLAPNITGVASADQAKSIYLAELAAEFAGEVLRPGGTLLFKAFQGEGYPELHKRLQREYGRVVTRKPRASRAESRELYLLCRERRA